MKKIIILIVVCMSSCVVPYSSYDYTEPTRTYYYPTYYQPTKIVVVKKKPIKTKRHVKVKINKHRKTKR